MRTMILLPGCLLVGLAGCAGVELDSHEEGVQCFETDNGVECVDESEDVEAVARRGRRGKRLHRYEYDECFPETSCRDGYEDIGALNLPAGDPDLVWGPCPPFFPDGCEIAVIQGDPSQNNSDIFFRVPANYEIPDHTHTSAERMVLVSGEMEVRYAGQEPTLLQTGDYAYGPAQAPHSATCTDQGTCVLMIAFNEPVDAFPLEGPGEPVAEQAVSFSPDDDELEWGPCPPIFDEGCEIAVAHGDPSQPGADVFFRVPGDFELPGHTHTSAERMVLMTGELEVEYPPQRPGVIRTLNYAYGPSEAPHRAYCRPGEACTLFIAFEEAVDVFALTCEVDDDGHGHGHGHGH